MLDADEIRALLRLEAHPLEGGYFAETWRGSLSLSGASLGTAEPGRDGRVATMGTGLRAGQRPQLVVPAGVGQGTRLASGGRMALLGTTMAPGFDRADFEHGRRTELVAEWPQHGAAIAALTRS